MKNVSHCSPQNRLIFNLTSAPIRTHSIQTYNMQHLHTEMSEMIFYVCVIFCWIVYLDYSTYFYVRSNSE